MRGAPHGSSGYSGGRRRSVPSRTKAKDNIVLSNSAVMTLGDALDAGLVTLTASDYTGRWRYFAREVGGNLCWQVGEVLYRSRLNRTGDK